MANIKSIIIGIFSVALAPVVFGQTSQIQSSQDDANMAEDKDSQNTMQKGADQGSKDAKMAKPDTSASTAATAATTGGDETITCTSGQAQRLIKIVYPESGKTLPCEVRYIKESGDSQGQTLWSATNKEGFCQEKAEEFKQKQIGWGWQCS